jgi:hypothetical protein
MVEDPQFETAVVTARRGLHAVAELVLAGPQWRTSGTIRLTVTPDGFATTRSPAPGIDQLAVRGEALVREPDGVAVPLAGPVDDLAAALGVVPGAPVGVYPDAGADAPTVLDLSPTGVDVILRALILGDQALRALTAAIGPAEPIEPVLWPEHFDLGVSVDEVNYGVSPGDAGHPLPYAYVGPWSARSGPFWNEPFGAARDLQELGDVPAVTEFLLEGRARAAAEPPA